MYQDFPKPQIIHQVWQFLGLTLYLRRFIRDHSLTAKPVTNLLRKNGKWTGGQNEQEAFDTLKRKLCENPVLMLYSQYAPIEVHTDAFKYVSRQTTKEEARYRSTELETLAVVWACKRFRSYLIGRNFKVVTDCTAVRSTFSKKDLVPRIGRWWLKMLEFQFEVELRLAERMQHVDGLSRNPFPQEEDTDCVGGIQLLTVELDKEEWGAAYTSTAFGKFCFQKKIIHILNASATLRANGQVEGLNHFVTPALASLTKEFEARDWDRQIGRLQYGINNTYHKAIETTPFRLLMIYEPRNHDGNQLEDETCERRDAIDIVTRRADALANILRDQEEQRRRYNKKRASARKCVEENIVVIRKDHVATRQSRKLMPKYAWPYIITQVLPNDRYRVAHVPETQRTQRFYEEIVPVEAMKNYVVETEDDASDTDDVDA
ncbi:RNase H-like domain found in reverse transcriptase [Popillia japonica]|uniref:RNA-directed DNA polymerase n=1 Tax=Popillia japonica TaxID=7064 RepID=A0AAW1JE35_POPJA